MNLKPKILIFSLAYHPFIGGAEVAIKEITDRLGDDFSFDLITVNLDGKQKAEEKIGNVNVYRVGGGKWAKYFFPWLGFNKAWELHQQNNYRLIWAMMANQAGWAALNFKKLFKNIPYLLTLQEGDSDWDIWLRTFAIRPIYKQIYRQADQIQVISNFLADRAKSFKVKCLVEVVPNGINISDKEVMRVEKDKPVVITVSRLVKKNGIAYLIQAMPDVEAKLVIIGDGYLKKHLERLVVKKGLAAKVEFKGQIGNQLVYDYLKQADVFCRPSLSEGLGNAFLEAMSCRIPVVATPVGGIVDFLKDGETGWFVKTKDVTSIAEKLNYILDLKHKYEVDQVRDRAYDLVKTKYNWQTVSLQIKDIVNKLLNE